MHFSFIRSLLTALLFHYSPVSLHSQSPDLSPFTLYLERYTVWPSLGYLSPIKYKSACPPGRAYTTVVKSREKSYAFPPVVNGNANGSVVATCGCPIAFPFSILCR